MMDDFGYAGPGPLILHNPQPNGWKLYLHGHGTSYATVISLMDDTKPPCWFHRIMVRWALGIIWVKE